jgi:hypothetical protein
VHTREEVGITVGIAQDFEASFVGAPRLSTEPCDADLLAGPESILPDDVQVAAEFAESESTEVQCSHVTLSIYYYTSRVTNLVLLFFIIILRVIHNFIGSRPVTANTILETSTGMDLLLNTFGCASRWSSFRNRLLGPTFPFIRPEH